MEWWLKKFEKKVYLLQGEREEETESLAAGKVGVLEVTLVSGIKIEVALKDFQPDNDAFSRNFMGSTASRSVFLSKWKKLSNCVERKMQKTDEQTKKKTPSSIVDEMLKDRYLGSFEIHLENLVGPEDGHGTREVDFRHVSVLEDSFQKDGIGQVVLLMGMLSSYMPDPGCLGEVSQHKVQVIGGNHTRLALQSLHEKGLLKSKVVLVNLYNPLGRNEALMLGYQHNLVLEEKKRPMTFLEKVKLMRQCRPCQDMTATDITKWKDDLCVIFRIENRRRLQSNMAHHLQMARLPEPLFVKVRQVDAKKQITDKFFKAMLRIDSNQAYDECLDVLLSEGPTAFNAKVSEFIGKGCVRSKKRSRQEASDQIDEIHCLDNDKENEVGESLEEKVAALEAQNFELHEELTKLREESKRSLEVCNESADKLKVGAIVAAKWKDDKFYPAKIQKIEKVFHVVYCEDKVKAKLKAEDFTDK